MTTWTLTPDLTRDVLAAIAAPDRCPDPSGHEREHEGSETTRRLAAQGRPYPVEASVCTYCGGAR